MFSVFRGYFHQSYILAGAMLRLHQEIEAPAVYIRKKDRPAVVTAENDMAESTEEMNPMLSTI